jgi:hypothetical protein
LTYPEELAQETTYYIPYYGELLDFSQAYEDYVRGRLNNVEIYGPTCTWQVTAPSLGLADFQVEDEASNFLIYAVTVPELESTTTRATTLAAPYTTLISFYPRTESMISTKSVHDLISRMSETPDDKTFIHYTIPATPVSKNRHLTVPDNATLSDIWKRLKLDYNTYIELLVRVSYSVL